MSIKLKKLITAKEKNLLPKVIIPIHMAGQSSDTIKIHKLAKKYGIKIVEDASHSIGGSILILNWFLQVFRHNSL